MHIGKILFLSTVLLSNSQYVMAKGSSGGGRGGGGSRGGSRGGIIVIGSGGGSGNGGSSLGIGAILGIVFGTLALVFLIAICIVWRQRQKAAHDAENGFKNTPATDSNDFDPESASAMYPEANTNLPLYAPPSGAPLDATALYPPMPGTGVPQPPIYSPSPVPSPATIPASPTPYPAMPTSPALYPVMPSTPVAYPAMPTSPSPGPSSVPTSGPHPSYPVLNA